MQPHSSTTVAAPEGVPVGPDSWLERRFGLTAHGTTVRTELFAGLTTFSTMAYIIFVNPTIMAAAGMDPLKTYDRLPSEEPRHNPETDARQSARLLLIALERLELNAEIAAQVLTPDPPAPDAPVEA